MDNSIKIISNNVRGLQNYLKRRKLFHYFNTSQQADIIMLQETHSTEKTENQWRSEWGSQVYFNHGTSDARGVCILIKNQVDFEVQAVKKDKEGRYLQLIGSINNKTIQLINVYGPNADDTQFFATLQGRVEEADTDYTIIAGDFNCILNNDMDKKGGASSHANKKCQGFLNTWIEESNLVDIWRQMHPTLRRYTYHKQRPFPVYSRLDYFLLSEGLTSSITSTSIQPGYCTDHSIITLTLDLINHPRGRGHWKFNNSLLTDMTYIRKMKDVIMDTRNSNQEANDQLLWDLIKYKIRQETIRMSSEKKRNVNNKLMALEKTLQSLEAERDDTGIEQEKIKHTREEIEKIQEEKTKGAMIRCKVRWYEEGEKSTKYFLNLEKRNYSKKVISRLKDKHNHTLSQPKEINNEIFDFYKKLYSSRTRLNDNLHESEEILSTIEKKLTNEESNQLEGAISEAEMVEALKTTPNGKSPGSDGLTAEFYKIFWTDIKDPLLKSVNAATTTGELSTTQKHGVITLLPKPGKDPLHLKNWRPISLLNQDYKLVAKCIASRIKTHLKNLIHSDQTGFIKGRHIGENINKLFSIMDYTEKEDIPAIIACIDFEKAFDSMEWNFIKKALEKFNFGPSMIQWVNTLYKNSVSCVLNNGWTTQSFELNRGVRQGCPLSPYLFILAAESLSCYIRKSKDIKGITVKGKEHKICQFADDTCLLLQYDTTSIDSALQAFDKFQAISGLKVNYEKTELFPVGAIRESEVPLYSKRNIKWSPKSVKVLGIHITYNKKDLLKKNYKQIVTKLENIIHIWKRRNLTLYGKVQIIKAHLQSQLIYQLSVLPSPPRSFLDKIQKILYQYLWNNKPDKIKRAVIQNSRENGGLAMPDIRHQNTALKVTWIQRILQNPNSAWSSCALATFPKEGLLILKGNISSQDLQQHQLLPTNNFWNEVVTKWADYCYKEAKAITEEETNNQPLWYNSHIKIRNQVLSYKNWQAAGVNQVKDLKDEYGDILDYQKFCENYDIETNFLEFYGVISAIPRHWRMNKRVMANSEDATKLCKYEKPTKIIYQKLLEKERKMPENLTRKWSAELQTANPNIDMPHLLKSFKMIYKCTESTKIRNFQYRLMHRILGINSKLYKWKIKDSPLCDLCKKEQETYSHLFCKCEKVQSLWKGIEEWTQQNTGLRLETTPTTIIFGTFNTRVLDLILNATKFYIYYCKMKKTLPQAEELIRRIEEIRNIEKYIAKKNNNIRVYEKKWNLHQQQI